MTTIMIYESSKYVKTLIECLMQRFNPEVDKDEYPSVFWLIGGIYASKYLRDIKI